MSVILRWIERLEPSIAVILLYAFWMPSPERDRWAWLILLWLPVFAARYLLCRRLWTNTLYDELLLVFLALCVINIFVSPYPTRGLILLLRPLLGMLLLWMCVEHVRTYGSATRLVWATLAAALLVAVISLTAVSWTGKATRFSDITDHLPAWQDVPPLWDGGFNPNEVAGAATWLMPVALGVALRRPGRWARGAAGVIALLLLAGLVLGQSLSGLAGALAGVLIVCAPGARWRWVALACVVAIIGAQALIMRAPDTAIALAKTVSPRDDFTSLDHRAVIWGSALAMLSDHPLTGTGMSNFRFLRADYPTPGFEGGILPHAHNEILQIGADLGVPGILVFVGWYAVAAYLIRQSWRHGDAPARALAVALAGGLVSHAVYGLADAIALWDRFAVLHWWLLGLVAANALAAQRASASDALTADTPTTVPAALHGVPDVGASGLDSSK